MFEVVDRKIELVEEALGLAVNVPEAVDEMLEPKEVPAPWMFEPVETMFESLDTMPEPVREQPLERMLEIVEENLERWG